VSAATGGQSGSRFVFGPCVATGLSADLDDRAFNRNVEARRVLANCESLRRTQRPLQLLVGLPACAAGLSSMKTFADPPTTTPPHPFLPPAIAAGRLLMKTSGEPSTTGAPLAVPSPVRAAGLPPIIVSGLLCVITPAG
jgi:hypothetical protein